MKRLDRDCSSGSVAVAEAWIRDRLAAIQRPVKEAGEITQV